MTIFKKLKELSRLLPKETQEKLQKGIDRQKELFLENNRLRVEWRKKLFERLETLRKENKLDL